jgi:hypothetical protein
LRTDGRHHEDDPVTRRAAHDLAQWIRHPLDIPRVPTAKRLPTSPARAPRLTKQQRAALVAISTREQMIRMAVAEMRR